MSNNVEILLSVMNIKNEIEYKNLLQKNKITGKVVAINQAHGNFFNIKEGKNRIYSYQEKGVSKSRNLLLEKAEGDICAFADDDTKYVKNYEEIIKNAYAKNKDAEGIIFFIENENTDREKTKRIGNRKINLLDAMRVRTCEITLKRKVLEKIRKENIKYDLNFGPGGTFKKGEETVFIADLLKSGIKIYSVNKKIASVKDIKSTWFTGYNENFLYDQGAIFYRISPKQYNLLILQYIIRKRFLYKENLSMKQAYKSMNEGAKQCKKIYKKGK